MAAIRPVLDAVLAKLYPGQAAKVESIGEPREPLTLRITVSSTAGVSDLLSRIDA